MEPVLFIAGLIALQLAAIALIDVLTSSRPWTRKLGWSLAILGMPLIGAIAYYRHGDDRPQRPSRTRRPRPAARRRS